MSSALRGMTWDHPRAYLPLEAFGRQSSAPSVHWDRQRLADFEARPLETLAPDYDLLVIDHPGLGRAIDAEAILPWDDVLTPDELAGLAATSVGPTWASYRLGERQWAIPVDAATQVSVAAAGLLPDLPATWAEVERVSRDVRTALCLGGPHAFLMLLALGAGGHGDAGPLLQPGTATDALELLRTVWRRCDREVSVGDPITVHEAIAAGAVDYCPLAYGYASYARPQPGARPVAWADAPAFAGDRPGSVLGGTGLALSARRATDLEAVRRWVRAFLAEDVQAGLVPQAAGQPAHRAAWDSPDVDRAWGGYYSATRRSLDAAWVRPRYAGWIGLQDDASALVREVLEGRADATAAVAEINDRHARLCAGEPVGATNGGEA